jgi:CO/xanthine dehydrogenase Mo-binding subunit
MKAPGERALRKEGYAKLSGSAQYVADLPFPDALWGATVRSRIPRGGIRQICYDSQFPWHECIRVSANEIPGQNIIALIRDDQPCLAAGEVRHAEEPILLIAHPDRGMAEGAREAVSVDYEPLPAVLSLEAARHDRPLAELCIEKGDVGAAFAAPEAIVVVGEYRTGAQEQLYIETQGMVVSASPGEGITVWGSLQCPFYVRKALESVFNLPGERIRVIQAETGGGFGGKEEYPSILAAHAALLSWHAGRPVKMIYDRAEDMAATTKRHPSLTRHRTAFAPDGTLLAMDIEFLLDGGAYTTLSPVVLSRGAIHAAGPYRCPNVRIRAKALATNTPPHGAFRGFGAPQSLFAVERHMDRAAARLGLAPEELRRRNFLRRGDTTSTRQQLQEEPALGELLSFALRESGYHEKRRRFDAENPGAAVRRGIGMAAFLHGAGFTGAGEVKLHSLVRLEAEPTGRVNILTSSAEIGQGARTVLPMIAAETLGVPCDWVEMPPPDTARVPDSGPTVASRTAMVVGKLVETAAQHLLAALRAAGLLAARYTPGQFAAACAAYRAAHGPLTGEAVYSAPPGIAWDEASYSGDAYGTYAWAVYVAEVSVDMVTYDVHVEDFVAVQDAGRILHPVLARGQIEGGVAQGIGFALYEQVVWRDGRMANATLADYVIPTSEDLPPIRVFFRESPYAHGPGGAKGLGELPHDGPAPAIANAAAHALGRDVRHIPLLAEDVLGLVEATHG